MTTTILTVGPLGDTVPLFPGGTMKNNFGGAGLPTNAGDGNTTRAWLGLPSGTPVVRLRYPASMAPDSIRKGVLAHDRALRDISGDVLVFAHSQGVQCCSRWLLTLGTRSDAPSPSRVSFLFIGNPLRKYGGFGVGRREFDGSIGQPTPNNTGYAVKDVSLQYDGWSDSPTSPGFWARINAERDRGGINFGKAIHAMGYRTASLTDPGKKTHVEGNTTYVLLPHAPLIGSALQSRIELSYDRPES